jgi:DnaK suppressor protein
MVSVHCASYAGARSLLERNHPSFVAHTAGVFMALTDSQRQLLAQRLREERTRLLGALGRSDETLMTTAQDAAGDLSKVPFHFADVGTEANDREVEAQEASRISRELAEIDDALERLYRHPDRFGRDERTGEEIPFERLEIVPWARTVVDAPAPGAAARQAAEEDRRLADGNDRYAG